MIYILFGEMGVGKNYVGEKLAKHLNCEFFDGDTVIPATMKEKIAKFKILDQKTVRNFIYNHLIPAVQRRAIERENLVVAQALYRKEFRMALIESLDVENVCPVYIKAPSFRTHMKRLLNRTNGVRWVAFCLISKFFLQKPDGDTFTISNEHENDLYSQIEKLVYETNS